METINRIVLHLNMLIYMLNSTHIWFYSNTDTETHYFVITINKDTYTDITIIIVIIIKAML